MTVKEVPLSYLVAREKFISAMARFRNHEEALQLLLGACDTGADLEEKMLMARTKGKHTEAIGKHHTLGMALDRAGDALDLATEFQRRRVAEQREKFDASSRHF
jgi:hypothetical protein